MAKLKGELIYRGKFGVQLRHYHPRHGQFDTYRTWGGPWGSDNGGVIIQVDHPRWRSSHREMARKAGIRRPRKAHAANGQPATTQLRGKGIMTTNTDSPHRARAQVTEASVMAYVLKPPFNKREPEPTIVLHLCTAGGGKDAWTSFADLENYNADPDAWAAKWFGLSCKQEYHEWIRLGGVALCGATTKRGKPCRAAVRHNLDAREWREWHRNRCCVVHGGNGAPAAAEPSKVTR